MGVRRPFVTLVGLFCSLGGVVAQRECTAKTTYNWNVIDVQYSQPTSASASVYVGLELAEEPGTDFECYTEWPVTSWDGWYEGSDRLVWAPCTNSPAGTNLENAVSIAVDWRNRVLFVAHTFLCSDRNFYTLATGSVQLGDSTSAHLTTRQKLIAPDPSGCPGSPTAYSSWHVDRWRRIDTGPTFQLYALATGETFTCQPSGAPQNGVSEGTCRRGSDASRTTAAFRFNTESALLKVTQFWNCGNTTTFETSGAAYIDATTSGPIFIGTKAF